MTFTPTDTDRRLMCRCIGDLFRENVPEDLARALDNVDDEKKREFFRTLFACLVDPVTGERTFIFFGDDPKKMRRNQVLLLVQLVIWSVRENEKGASAFSVLAAINEANRACTNGEFDEAYYLHLEALRFLHELNLGEQLEDAAAAYMHTVYYDPEPGE